MYTYPSNDYRILFCAFNTYIGMGFKKIKGFGKKIFRTDMYTFPSGIYRETT